jgi:hypothetical protein
MNPEGSIVDHFAAKAIRLGADRLEVEYKDGREQIDACKQALGFGIGSLDSSDLAAKELCDELWAMRRRKREITVDGVRYELRCSVYDSFGETAFRVAIQKATGSRKRPPR